MNLVALLERIASERSERAAIIDERRGTRVTYCELLAAATSLSAGIRAARLPAGARILVGIPMSIDLYATLLGIWHAGMVAVVPDISAVTALRVTVGLAKPDAFIASPRMAAAAVLPELMRIPEKLCTGWFPGFRKLVPSAHGAATAATVDEDAPALITFTSGSTGRPKTVVRTHRVLHAQMKAILDGLRLGGTTLDTMPIVLLANLAAGGTSVIPNVDLRHVGKADPESLASAISRNACDTMIASPAILAVLAAWYRSTGQTLPTLRNVYSGGAPVFPILLSLFHDAAPQAQIHAIYGSTEAEPIAHLDAIGDDELNAMRSGLGLLAGRPDPRTDVRIIRAAWGTPLGPYSESAFDALRMPENEPGEIVVSGAHVLTGYDRGIGDEETKIRVDGRIWHRTGDLGRIDAQGRIWLLGRASAVIQRNGKTVYPLAVECAASFIPGIERSALIERSGRTTLFVQGNVDSIVSLPDVDDVVTIAKIPVDRRHNAKIDYPALHRLIQQHALSK